MAHTPIDQYFEPIDDPIEDTGTGKPIDQSFNEKQPDLDISRRRLTERQVRFVDWYSMLGDATQAAKRSGYKYAPVMSGPMLAYLSEIVKSNKSPLIGDSTERQIYLTRILRDDPTLDPKLACEIINLLNKMQGAYAQGVGASSGKLVLDYEIVSAEPREASGEDTW